MEEVCEKSDRGGWFPFTGRELEVGLTVFGALAGVASLVGLRAQELFVLAGAYALVFYLAGLLVHARRDGSGFRFAPDSSLSGEGYVEPFRHARRSLFLMHVDEDAPGEELLALYRSLLGKGVQIRRILFLKDLESVGERYRWVQEFGNHENLEQRVVPPEESRVMWFCFVLVDAAEVILALPGYEPVDEASLAKGFVLRHLLRIRDKRVVATFIRTYQAMWEQAVPLEDAGELSDVSELVRKRRGSRGPSTSGRSRGAPGQGR